MEENKNNRENENEIYESNAARRLRLQGGGTPEPASEDETPPKKANFFENLWYHYKTPIILVVAFGIIFTVGLVQLLRKDSPDAYVLYAGPVSFSYNDSVAAEESLTSFLSGDLNGDGKTSVKLISIYYVPEDKAKALDAEAKEKGEHNPIVDYAGSQENRSAYQAFSDNMLAGDAVIVLLDPYLFELIKDAGGLVPLSEALGFTPESAIDEYGADAKMIPAIASDPLLSALPDDTVLAIRRVSAISAFTGKKKEEKAHERQVKYARDLFGYVPEEPAESE